MKEVVGHKKDLGEIAEIKLAAAGKPTDDDRGEVEDESGVKGRESRGETFSKESKGRDVTGRRPDQEMYVVRMYLHHEKGQGSFSNRPSRERPADLASINTFNRSAAKTLQETT